MTHGPRICRCPICSSRSTDVPPFAVMRISTPGETGPRFMNVVTCASSGIRCGETGGCMQAIQCGTCAEGVLASAKRNIVA
eukprot:5857012-Prymnesium_polylepis.1